jgi:hypothetical protein
MNEPREDFKATTLARIELHLHAIKWLILLLIATLVYPPIGLVFLVLAVVVAIAAALGIGSANIIKKFRD